MVRGKTHSPAQIVLQERAPAIGNDCRLYPSTTAMHRLQLPCFEAVFPAASNSTGGSARRRGDILCAQRPRRQICRSHNRRTTSRRTGYLQTCLQEIVCFGDTLGDSHSPVQQGRQAEMSVCLQISKDFCVRRRGSRYLSRLLPSVAPTFRYVLVFLLVSIEQSSP